MGVGGWCDEFGVGAGVAAVGGLAWCEVFSGFPESCFESGVVGEVCGGAQEAAEDGEPEVHARVHVNDCVAGGGTASAGFTGLCYET